MSNPVPRAPGTLAFAPLGGVSGRCCPEGCARLHGLVFLNPFTISLCLLEFALICTFAHTLLLDSRLPLPANPAVHGGGGAAVEVPSSEPHSELLKMQQVLNLPAMPGPASGVERRADPRPLALFPSICTTVKLSSNSRGPALLGGKMLMLYTV